MSDDGSYTAVALTKKVVLSSGIFEGEYEEIAEWHVDKILFFDRFGNLLWAKDAAGYPVMSKNGKYILARSEYYGLYHIFFDKEGNILWQKPFTREDLWFYGEGISDDGNYIIIDNTLYNKKGEALHIYDVEEEVKPVISAYGNYIAIRTSNKTLFYDRYGKLLWKLSDPNSNVVKFSSDENYLIVDTYDKIKIFDKNGRLLWSKPKNFKQTYTVQGCDFTNNGKFFAIGVVKNISFEPYFVESNVTFYDKNGNIIWKLDFSGNAEKFENISLSFDGKYLAIIYGNILYFYDNSETIK
jgi:hypothetical protein